MQHRRWWAALAGVATTAALLVGVAGAGAQAPSPTEHPVPTTPPGATATRPPGPWVDPVPAPQGCVPEVEANDQPADAGVRVLPTEFCVSGTLEAVRDQDLYFWEVPGEDGLTTWDVSVRGVPTTYTSVHVFQLDSPVGVTPIDLGEGEVARVDSDVWVGTPVPTTGLRLRPGPYLLGISRAEPGYDQDITDDLSYWVELQRGARATLPSGDAEPNDDPETAVPVEGAASFGGDAGGTRDVYRWQIPGGDPTPWRIALAAAPSSSIDLVLTDPDRQPIARADVDAAGHAALEDLGLPTGAYLVWVEGRATADPYTLTIEHAPPDVDPEPNDDAEHAVVLDPATLAVTGRLSTDADRDRFWADIDRSRTERLTDVTLAWSDGSQRELCIGDGDGATIACGTGVGEVRLRGLMLSAGRYLLSVDGAGGPDDRYRLTVGSSGVEQPAREVEPNDDVTTAHAVSGAFAIGGDLGDGDRDVLAWTVSEADASHAWHLDLSATLGSRAWFALHDPTGTQVADTQTGPAGDGRLWDLRLTPGTWTIEVTPGGGPSPAYVVRATEDTDADIDAEPNGRVARPIDPATLLARGRLAGDGDRDLYSFDLTEAMADTLTTIDLSWSGAGTRSLCLRTGQGSFIQCAEGVGEAVMSSLDLEAGPYALEVSGDPSPSTRYALTVRAGDARSVDAESEPNDAPETADLWDPTLPMHGTARDGDPDVYRVSMPLGVPHRWQLTVLGTGLEAPVWQQPDGASAGTSAVTDDGTMATVEDLLLVGGDHVLTIAADGDYVLTLTDLGEIDPSAETEPNDTPERAGRLAWDATRHGRLATTADVDVYRFTLAAPEHVRITATPDDRAGGDVASGGVALGEPERDADPRGLIDVAVISTTTPLARAPGDATQDPVVLDAMLPPGDHEVWLRTAARGGAGYTLRLERRDPFLVPGAAAPHALPVTLAIVAPTTRVAAFVTQGQRVDATLSLANGSDTPLDLDLRAVTSDLRWTVDLPTGLVLDPGATTQVPLAVRVPPDASRDVPVRITVAARTLTGAQATASFDVTPAQDAAPVSPSVAWPLPDALLGGLDVAATSLGAVPGGSSGEEAQLHDGYAVAGAGMRGYLQGGPFEVSVDLAGDDPVPVAGTILDATALEGILGARPRAFELWLSADGSSWERVLASQASTLTMEQAFALPRPVEARFARLRVLSNWGDPNDQLALGEWKVVAAPGWAPAGPVDVASSRLGGHVVWTAPDLYDSDMASLLEGVDTEVHDNVRYRPEDAQRLVIGFRDDRAAQVERLEWVEQAGTDPAIRFARAHVGVSTGSPLGPWRDLGVWDVSLRADGTVTPFDVPDGTWARFVQLTLEVPADQEAAYRALPGELRIIERATDDTYRSVVGEWGQSSPRGPFEALVADTTTAGTPDEPEAPDDVAGALAVPEGAHVRGQVARNVDVDWYQVTVPAGQNELTLRLATARANEVRMTILDADGRPAEFTASGDPATGERVWKAFVTPGQTYRVGLEQPVLSVVIAFDSSGSVAPWWPLIRGAVRTFVDDITPGQEAAIVLPYQEPPLPADWSDQPWLIRAALDARAGSSGSSCIACALADADGLLAARDGARALLVLGDAVGGGLEGGLEEAALDATGTAVFTVHFGAPGDEASSTAIMQDLARANGGFYQYATSTGDVDRAFDRMATWLRRPADYAFSWDADAVPPGTISVTPAAGAQVRIGGVAVELVLDTSGSMDAALGKRKRIDVAKRSLSRLVQDSLPEGLPVALRTFRAGTRKRPSCATSLAVPLGPLDKAAMLGRIDRIKIGQGTKTPLAAAIEAAGGDIGGVEGPRIVVVVTDGAETCQGDPEAAVRGLVATGIDTTVNIVGFALDDDDLKGQMASWAEAGGGTFFDAQDQAGLSAGMTAALRAPYRVYDAKGVQVADGIVGDAPVTVQPGTYRVEVLSEPPIVIEDVEVAPGTGTSLTVGGEGG